jgi:hypothetical protein
MYFSKEEIPADICVEYMDTKRYLSSIYLQQLNDIYRIKYASTGFDCIISSDDDALNFLIKYGRSLFGKTPVVFTGINSLNITEIIDRKIFTGVMEEESPAETIKLMQKLHPGLKSIYAICDYTTTGRARYNSISKIIPQFKEISFKFSPDLPVKDLFAEIQRLDEETPLLLLAYFKDRNGRIFFYNDFTGRLKTHARGPVYTVALNYLKEGVIGGVLNSPEKQGTEAAIMVARILNGEIPERIPVIEKVHNSAVVDYREAVKKRVDVSLIPDDAEVINRPPDFFDFIIRNKTYVIYLTLIFLSITVLILAVSIISVMRINRLRKKIVSDLANALLDVKTLSGLLPICASCKKIRDDRGYWSQIEQYLEQHSDAEFTHSLCPDCAKKLYPDIFNGEEKK